jgi:hypothetical protein
MRDRRARRTLERTDRGARADRGSPSSTLVDARRRRVVARTNAERRTRERTNDERTNGDVSTKRRGER